MNRETSCPRCKGDMEVEFSWEVDDSGDGVWAMPSAPFAVLLADPECPMCGPLTTTEATTIEERLTDYGPPHDDGW